MSRLISKKLFFRNATVSHSLSTTTTTLFLRHRSSKPPQNQLIEVDLCGEHDVTLKLFDQLIQRILVKKSTPDWLPFVPGSSFWVPPRTTPSNVVDLVQNLSDEETLSLVTLQGCPSSKFFMQELESARDGDTDMELNIPEGTEDTVKVKVPTIPGSAAHSEDEEG
ncbi:hypothetical protein TanjilG_16171 [Lupinus angustifolius]|uniref:Uncharacterized protein n=1 Tax=Lupinus angustifolius TaxID=3871 RepID=A0A1J7HAD2_LUPAN|nr:PREDICTED: uncharacterized protein LOC109328779 [Lupinus angustifolius]XP_019417942.1 PREDICTED: uncharacterized protein LOC109328779 [Lupinus angustifolius]OIV97410.1 hypothetical protein TanjilG_16171 [Lupinus angustifolius]